MFITQENLQKGIGVLTDPKIRKAAIKAAKAADKNTRLEISNKVHDCAKEIAVMMTAISPVITEIYRPYLEAMYQSAERLQEAALNDDDNEYMIRIEEFLDYQSRIFEFGMTSI